MSAALARLRRKFDDELLTRNGRDYDLTPFALELLPEVQHALRLMSKALHVEEGFDPATSERSFLLTMSDYALSVAHEPLLTRVSELAPGVRLRVDHLGPDIRTNDRVLLEYDVVVGPLGFGFPGESRPLWRDRMVCLVDGRFHNLEHGLTLEDLARLPHAQSTFGAGNLTPVDRVFGELDIHRNIQVSVSGWLPLPFVLAGTNLVAVVPERLAKLHTCADGPLVQVEPPFGEVVLAEGYWFAHDRLADPAHLWLFERFDEVGAVLAQEGNREK
jgi:DNA-binding transcriptional LysR family regulator